IGRLVVAASGELVRLGAIGQHGPYLPGAAAGGFENEVAAVGSPTGTLVAGLVTGQLHKLARGGVHNVGIVVVVGAAPTASQPLAIVRPSLIDDIAFVREVDVR